MVFLMSLVKILGGKSLQTDFDDSLGSQPFKTVLENRYQSVTPAVSGCIFLKRRVTLVTANHAES